MHYRSFLTGPFFDEFRPKVHLMEDGGADYEDGEEDRGSKKEISFSLFLCFLMNMAVLCLEIPPIFSVLLIEFAASQKMTFVNRTATILMPS